MNNKISRFYARSLRERVRSVRLWPAAKAFKAKVSLSDAMLVPAAANPFESMVKLTDNMSIGEALPYAEKVLDMRNECFKHLPVFENYMLQLRGDTTRVIHDAKGNKRKVDIPSGPILTSCVRNEKRVRLDTDLEKAYFLFSLMDQILQRITVASGRFKINKKEGVQDTTPYILFGFEKFNPQEIFVRLEPFTERFFGDVDDEGITIWNPYPIMIPDQLAEDPDPYFQDTNQEARIFGFSKSILGDGYIGLADEKTGRSYTMDTMGFITHYNLLLVARHILSFVHSQV
jgi:hypothetical protein